MPRGDRSAAGDRRAARIALSDAGLLQRGNDFLPRVVAVGARGAGRARRGRGHRAADVLNRRRARDGAPRRDRRYEDGGRAYVSLGFGLWALGFGLWALGFGLWPCGVWLWALVFGKSIPITIDRLQSECSS